MIHGRLDIGHHPWKPILGCSIMFFVCDIRSAGSKAIKMCLPGKLDSMTDDTSNLNHFCTSYYGTKMQNGLHI